MKILCKLLFLALIILQSCKSSIYTDNEEVKEKTQETSSFIFHVTENIHSIFPLKARSKTEKIVSSQVYECLFKYDSKNLRLQNCLIDSYKIDSTSTEYTFTLKDNIYFHDDKCFKKGIGRILTSRDIIHCFSKLCETDHIFSNILAKPILAADSLTAGLQFLDDLRFIIKLKKPYTGLEHLLTQVETGIYPKEMNLYSYQNKINKEVGTGPFIIKTVSNDIIQLTKNKKYYLKDDRGSRLPYLQKLTFLIEKNNDSSLYAFQNGKIDFINKIDTDKIFDLQYSQYAGISNVDIHHQAALSFDYIGINLNDTIMNNLLLRKSIAFAIDKKNLLEKALNGEADHPSTHGLTPEFMKKINGYDVNDIKSIKFNVDSAKKYFKAAKEFDSLAPKNITLYYIASDKRHEHIAVELSKQLKTNLSIDLLIEPCTKEKLKQSVENNTAVIFLQTMNYNIPHPIDALRQFRSLAYIHTDKLLNFDKLLDSCNHNIDVQATFNYCKKAETELINDIVILPLWSNENYEVVQPDVKNLYINGLQYYDFRTTNIDKIKQLLPVSY